MPPQSKRPKRCRPRRIVSNDVAAALLDGRHVVGDGQHGGVLPADSRRFVEEVVDAFPGEGAALQVGRDPELLGQHHAVRKGNNTKKSAAFFIFKSTS